MTRLRRRANRAFYRLLFRAYRALLPAGPPPGRLPTAGIRRLLVVRHDALGDMAVTLPALAYLRATLPDAEIDVLASPRNAALLAGDARVTNVLVNARGPRPSWRLVRALRARRYDVIVSPLLRGGLREGVLAALASHRGTARVSPWRQRQYVGLFTHPCRVPRAERHMAERLLALVQRTIGDGTAPPRADVARWPAAPAADAAADARVATFLASHVGRPFVALNAWAAEPHRDLGAPLATTLAAALVARGHAVVLTPPPGRTVEAEGIAAAAGVVAAPAGAIADLVALLRRAALVVTPDTANVHLASAVGTPVVSVHTPIGADVRDWGPWGVPNRTVVLPDPRPLRDAPATAVLAAVDALARELGA